MTLPEGPGVEDLIRPHLTLVFVGFNPSLAAWRRGHYYANPGNRFYRLLAESGITPRLFRPEEDTMLLDLGIGIVDLLPGCPSARADEYADSAYRAGSAVLAEKLAWYEPKAVCANGYGVYRYLFGTRPERPGLQPGVRLPWGAQAFASPSTSGLANGHALDRRAAFAELAAWFGGSRAGEGSTDTMGS